MKITAKIIAEQLGLSTATVDRVLNNRGGVSEKTIKKVKEKVKELGYKPNKAAKFLSTQKKTEVGFILPVIPTYFWDEVELGIKEAAVHYKDFGFETHIHRVDTPPKEKQINYIQGIIGQDLYDALVISPHDADPYINIINEGIKKGIPIFTLNNDVPKSKRISFVGADYYSAGFLAGELIHSFTKKLKNIVIIREDENTYQMINKEKGFKDYFSTNKINVNINTIPVRSDNIILSKWMAEVLMSSNAIYVANGILGEVAEYMFNVACKEKILIGHDISEKIYTFLNNNVIKAAICQDPLNQARMTVQKVFEYVVLDEKVKISNSTSKLEIVTKANAKYFIN